MKKDIIEIIKNQNQNIETKSSEVQKGSLDEYMKTQLGLGLAGMVPGYGIGADVAAFIHSIQNKQGKDSLLNLGAMVPGIGLFAGAKKVDELRYLMKNTGMSEKEALEVINKYQKSGGNTPVMPDKRVVDASPQDIQTLKNKYRRDARDQIKSAEKVVEEDINYLNVLKEEKGFTSGKIKDILKKALKNE